MPQSPARRAPRSGRLAAEWIWALAAVATLNPEEMKKQAFSEGEVQAAVVHGGCDVPEAALLGTGTCGFEALRTEFRAVSRQAYNVSVPTFRLKLDLFKLSKQVSFDGARRIPMLRQMNQGPAVQGDVLGHRGPRMPSAVPLRWRSDSTLPEVKSWRESLGAPCSARGAGRGTAVTPWPRGGQARQWASSPPVDAPRRGKTSVAKRHAFKKRTVCTTRQRTHMSGGGAT